jgi:hypothetical protein
LEQRGGKKIWRQLGFQLLSRPVRGSKVNSKKLLQGLMAKNIIHQTHKDYTRVWMMRSIYILKLGFFNTSQSYFAGWITRHIMVGLQCCHCLLPKAKPGSLVCSVFLVIFSL